MNHLESKLEKLNTFNRKLNGQQIGNYLGLGLLFVMLICLMLRVNTFRKIFFWDREPRANVTSDIQSERIVSRLNLFKR